MSYLSWGGEDSFGLVPMHFSAVRRHRFWSVGGSNPRAGEVVSSSRSNGKVVGDKEAVNAAASSRIDWFASFCQPEVRGFAMNSFLFFWFVVTLSSEKVPLGL